MRRRWVLLIIGAFAVSILAWGYVKSGIARDEEEEEMISITKPERKYNIRTLNKLDAILSNQKIIMEDLEEIKKAVNR